jgi:choline dehydrogenase
MMGPDPRRAVVDGILKVYEIRGLCVFNSSVFPGMNSGSTNAPTIMLAEKAADIIQQGS